MKYQSGTGNPADFCSRHPLPIVKESRTTKVVEDYVNFVGDHASPKAKRIQYMKREAIINEEPQSVVEANISVEWRNLQTNPHFKTYHLIRDELCVNSAGDLLLRVNRIVMPQSLRKRAIELAHEVHQGIVKTKHQGIVKTKHQGIV